MLDTIKIAHSIQLDSPLEILLEGGWKPVYDQKTGFLKEFYYKEAKGSQYPYLSIFTGADGLTYLTVRVSIPAFLFGSNVNLPDQSQVYEGLARLTEYVSAKSGFDFDAQTAKVWEVHFTKNFFVGDAQIYAVLSKLSDMNIPRFQIGKYNDSTLYFHSKGRGKEERKPRTICIYAKKPECESKHFRKSDIDDAEGLLRLEFRYKKYEAVKSLVKCLKLPNSEAQTVLQQAVSDFVLAPIQDQMLNLMLESEPTDRLQKLVDCYGKRASRLVHFLVAQYVFGKDFYQDPKHGFSRSAYYECQKLCRDVGVLALFNLDRKTIEMTQFP